MANRSRILVYTFQSLEFGIQSATATIRHPEPILCRMRFDCGVTFLPGKQTHNNGTKTHANQTTVQNSGRAKQGRAVDVQNWRQHQSTLLLYVPLTTNKRGSRGFCSVVTYYYRLEFVRYGVRMYTGVEMGDPSPTHDHIPQKHSHTVHICGKQSGSVGVKPTNRFAERDPFPRPHT